MLSNMPQSSNSSVSAKHRGGSLGKSLPLKSHLLLIQGPPEMLWLGWPSMKYNCNTAMFESGSLMQLPSKSTGKGSGLSDKCKMWWTADLLNGKRWTAHILNCCKVSLNSCRYNKHHDEVLAVMVKFLKEPHRSGWHRAWAELHLPFWTGTYTDLRPDIVVLSRLQKIAIIVELAICWESVFVAAWERKTAKYLELATGGAENGYSICRARITLDTGWRELFCIDGFQQLQDTFMQGSKYRRNWSYRMLLYSTAIMGSYIYKSGKTEITPPQWPPLHL